MVQASTADYLMTRRGSDLPVTASGYQSSDLLRLLNSVGTKTIQEVPPSVVQTQSSRSLVSHHCAVSAREASFEALRDATTLFYLWTHESWAPVGKAEEALVCRSLGLPDEVDLDLSSVVIDESGQVLALALVFPDEEEPVLIAETTRRDTPNGQGLVAACLKRSLELLAEAGIEEVQFDGHVSDPHFYPVWMSLSPRGEKFIIAEVIEPQTVELKSEAP